MVKARVYEGGLDDLSHRKPERCAVADDVAGGGAGEVRADDEDRLVGPFGEEARAREGDDPRVVVAERPVRARPIWQDGGSCRR